MGGGVGLASRSLAPLLEQILTTSEMSSRTWRGAGGDDGATDHRRRMTRIVMRAFTGLSLKTPASTEPKRREEEDVHAEPGVAGIGPERQDRCDDRGERGALAECGADPDDDDSTARAYNPAAVMILNTAIARPRGRVTAAGSRESVRNGKTIGIPPAGR
jgi:hypothetical protein